MKVDLPAFGRPSRPTSASTRSSSPRLRLSPGAQRALAVAGEIGDQRATRPVADHGAHRHAQLDVAARPAVAVGAGAPAAVLRPVDAREARSEEHTSELQ